MSESACGNQSLFIATNETQNLKNDRSSFELNDVCTYTFQHDQMNLSATLNIKLSYQNDFMEVYVAKGTSLDQSYDEQLLGIGMTISADYTEKIFLVANLKSAFSGHIEVEYWTGYVEPEKTIDDILEPPVIDNPNSGGDINGGDSEPSVIDVSKDGQTGGGSTIQS